jgi:hypothetical protein
MPNIDILCKIGRSPLLKAVQASNEEKIEREARRQTAGHTLVATIKE